MMKILFLSLFLRFSLCIDAQSFSNVQFYGEITEPSCTISAIDETVQIKLISSCYSIDSNVLTENLINKNVKDFQSILPANKGTYRVETVQNNPNKKLIVIDYL